MKILQWKEGLTPEQEKEVAYFERNMLALRHADGWYYDTDNNWDGWKRVLSLEDGRMNFHIPDDFDVGNLKQIEPKWDGHGTRNKWQRVFSIFGIKEDK